MGVLVVLWSRDFSLPPRGWAEGVMPGVGNRASSRNGARKAMSKLAGFKPKIEVRQLTGWGLSWQYRWSRSVSFFTQHCAFLLSFCLCRICFLTDDNYRVLHSRHLWSWYFPTDSHQCDIHILLSQTDGVCPCGILISSACIIFSWISAICPTESNFRPRSFLLIYFCPGNWTQGLAPSFSCSMPAS